MADGRTLYVILTANASGYKAALRGAADDTRQFGREVEALDGRLSDNAVQSRRMSDEINQMSGRMRIFVDAAAALGPALVPIGALGVPAITGIAAQLGIATAGALAAVLAFQGVGEAMKAIDEAEADPSLENLQKLHTLLQDLQPSARAFLAEVQAMKPALDQVQNAAADGLFPDLVLAMRELEQMSGPLADGVGMIAEAMGSVALEQAQAFNSERGREFVAFLASEAKPQLSILASTVGNLVAAMGELWMAFDPVNDDFSNWLLDQARALDQWASKLDQTEGFESFLDYLSETGPQVAETLGAIGGMLVDIVVAAAPLGGPVLAGLEAFAKAVSFVAESDAGTPLLAAAAAATILNRALQLTASVLGRVAGAGATAGGGMAGMFSSTRNQTSQISSSLSTMSQRAQAARTSLAGLGGAVKTLGTTWATAGATSAREQARAAAAANTLKSAMGGVAGTAGRAGAAVGAMAVLTTDAGQQLGVTNTAMLGLAGSMAGPWGAALGAGAGLLLDFSNMGDLAAESQAALVDGMADAAAAMDFQAMQMVALADAEAQYVQNRSAMQDLWDRMDESFTGENARDSVREAQEAARDEFEQTKAAWSTLMTVMEGPITDSIGRSINPSMQDLTAFAERAKPALDALGYSFDEISNMDAAGLRQVGQEVAEYQRYADSAAGRTEAFANSVAGLGNDALATADSAGVMASALDALLSPTLSAEAATDAWRQSLKDLQANLQSGAGFKGFTEAAMANRDATRSYTETAMERLKALAGVSTTTQGDMARAVAETRQEFIRSAVAAGMDRKAVVARANAMGLTPKLVRTVFEAAGINETTLQVRRAKSVMEGLPKNVQTQIRADGIPQTMGQVNALVRKYDLTERERRALITLRDLASRGVELVNGKLRHIDGRRVEAKVDANTAGFDAKTRRAREVLMNLDRQKATPNADLNTTQFTSKQRRALNDVGVLDRQKPTPTANLNDGPFQGRKNRVMADVRQVDSQRPTPVANMNDGPFSGVQNNVMSRLNVTDRFTATPTATLIDRASGPAQNIINLLNSIPRTVTSTVTTFMDTVKRTFSGNEDGALHVDGVRAFADGGYGADGRYYSRDPQMVAGGANILWGEKATGWEAYISGKPSQRERNLQVLGEAARRLGVEVSDPDRRYDASHRGVEAARPGGAGGTVLVRERLAGRVELVVDGATFTAYVRGHAADVADRKITAVDESEARDDRRNW